MPYTPSGFFCDRLIRERERRDGEGSLNKPLRFNGQDFNALRQECLQRKTLFEDESFPATVESLGFKELGHKSNKVKNIVWKRPKVGGGVRHMERHVDHKVKLRGDGSHVGGGTLFLIRCNIKPAWKTNCCCGILPGDADGIKIFSTSPKRMIGIKLLCCCTALKCRYAITFPISWLYSSNIMDVLLLICLETVPNLSLVNFTICIPGDTDLNQSNEIVRDENYCSL